MPRGAFITFDGGEGAGKTTQIAALSRLLSDAGRPVRVFREPGGTDVGERIRAILLDPSCSRLDARAELLLYEAARAQLVSERILPALDEGCVVICDRFSDSTVAYQGYGRGLDLDVIGDVDGFATRGLVPDRTLLLEIDPTLGLSRAVSGHRPDRLERAGGAFHERVHEGFARLSTRHPDRIRVIAVRDSASDTLQAVLRALADLSALPAHEVLASLFERDRARYLGDLA
ncbi:MAG: dTMP kinase [Coriobacteriales bacterium]